MESVRLACISTHSLNKPASIYLNFTMLQGEYEYPGIGEPFAGTIEFYFDYAGNNYYQNDRRLYVDSWKGMKSVIVTEFVNDMFKIIGTDVISKTEVLDMVDRMFKNDKSHSTPLMLAAQDGNLYTVH